MGKIHQKVRELIGADLNQDDELIENFLAMAQIEFGNLLGIAAVVLDAAGLHKDREHLIDRLTKRRLDLERKNQHLDSLSCRYVSSKC